MTNEQLVEQVAALQKQVTKLTMAFDTLSEIVVRRGSRVQIENLEGCFKFYTALPTDATQFKSGTLVIVNDGASVFKIGVIMNDGTIKSANIA